MCVWRSIFSGQQSTRFVSDYFCVMINGVRPSSSGWVSYTEFKHSSAYEGMPAYILGLGNKTWALTSLSAHNFKLKLQNARTRLRFDRVGNQRGAGMQKDDKIDPVALILLIRWLEHNVPGADGKKLTLGNIAEACGVSRHVLNRFLGRKMNLPEEADRAEKLLEPVRVLLDQARPFSPALRKLYGSVYEDAEPLDIDEGKPIRQVEVVRHLAMARIDVNEATLRPLYGLSVLIRVANEVVPPTRQDEKKDVHGWSVSLMNVVPPHVQAGLNHPLFKLRQRGKNGASSTIEGVVITRDDRFIFQGTDTLRRLPFNATMRMPDDGMRSYRDADAKVPLLCTGVMLGLRSAGETFGTLFELLAVPGAEPPFDADSQALDQFRQRYTNALEATGVRNLPDTIDALLKIGFYDAGWLQDKLRDMRSRCPEPLRPF